MGSLLDKSAVCLYVLHNRAAQGASCTGARHYYVTPLSRVKSFNITLTDMDRLHIFFILDIAVKHRPVWISKMSWAGKHEQ